MNFIRIIAEHCNNYVNYKRHELKWQIAVQLPVKTQKGEINCFNCKKKKKKHIKIIA